jgi:hypothetical protein
MNANEPQIRQLALNKENHFRLILTIKALPGIKNGSSLILLAFSVFFILILQNLSFYLIEDKLNKV